MSTLSLPVVLTSEDLATIAGDMAEAFHLAGGPDRPSSSDDTVCAWVQVAGAWTGRVVLDLGADAATDLARTLLGLPATEAPDPRGVLDAVGELANVAGGNVKSLLPAPSTLGLPQVGSPAAPAGAGPGSVELCRTAVRWAGHDVQLSVWAEAPAPAPSGEAP